MDIEQLCETVFAATYNRIVIVAVDADFTEIIAVYILRVLVHFFRRSRAVTVKGFPRRQTAAFAIGNRSVKSKKVGGGTQTKRLQPLIFLFIHRQHFRAENSVAVRVANR